MRLLLLASVLAGCTDTAVDENITHRRLRDQFTSYEQCLAEGDFTPCYQTLVMCPDNRTRIDLSNAPETGSYTLIDSMALLTFRVMGTIEFDLESASSPDLPGVHAWERIEPIVQGCD